jgi:hypothetical protein
MTDAAWQRCAEAAKLMFSQLTLYFRVIDDCPPQTALWTDSPPDEWDWPLWTAAERAEAVFIVTDNVQNGPPKGPDGVQEHAGIFIVHPDVFLRLIDWVVSHYVEAAYSGTEATVTAAAASESAGLYRSIIAEIHRRASGHGQ